MVLIISASTTVSGPNPFNVRFHRALNWQPHIMDMNADIPARKRDTPRIVLPRNLRMISLSGKDADCVMSPGNRSLLQLG